MSASSLERRVARVRHRAPLSEMSEEQRSELREFLATAKAREDLPGKWHAAIVAAEQRARHKGSALTWF